MGKVKLSIEVDIVFVEVQIVPLEHLVDMPPCFVCVVAVCFFPTGFRHDLNILMKLYNFAIVILYLSHILQYLSSISPIYSSVSPY